MQLWSVTFNRELGHDYKKTTKESHKFLTKQRDPDWAVYQGTGLFTILIVLFTFCNTNFSKHKGI